MQFKVINLDLIIKVKTEKTPLVANFMGRKHELGTGEHSFVFPLRRIDQILEAYNDYENYFLSTLN